MDPEESSVMLSFAPACRLTVSIAYLERRCAAFVTMRDTRPDTRGLHLWQATPL